MEIDNRAVAVMRSDTGTFIMEAEMLSRKVRLRCLSEADLPAWAEWTADDELCTLMGIDREAKPFVSPEEELPLM